MNYCLIDFPILTQGKVASFTGEKIHLSEVLRNGNSQRRSNSKSRPAPL